MSFVDLDQAIDHELVRCNEKLIPYLQEMHDRLDAQGSRNDLHADTPAIGWQAWVKSKQDMLGSLSKVNRLLAAPREPAPELSAVEDAVVKALVAQGYKKKDAVRMTKKAKGEDFDSLFRGALRSTHSDDEESPDSEGEEPDEDSSDDEEEADSETPVVVEEVKPNPLIAELQAELNLVRTENASLLQRLQDKVPEHLRDENITAALAAESDTGRATDLLEHYLQTVVERVLPTHCESGKVDVNVSIVGRDDRIMPGDWLRQQDRFTEGAPMSLAKCTGIAEFMSRRRVREWENGEWGKEHVLFDRQKCNCTVITEAAARELAPEAFKEEL